MVRMMKIGLAAVALAGTVQAEAISVQLGESAEILTLYGRGPISPGIGSFDVGQGASSFDGTTSTFVLSGAITGGDPGYDTGTYRFVTTYAGPDTPDAGPNAPLAQTNPQNPLFFFYREIDPSTTITLFLDTPDGDFVIPLFVNDAFVPGTNFSFLRTNSTCTGVAVCTQNNVGLTPGATIFGPVTITATFPEAPPPPPPPAVPEPATWGLMLAGFGLVGVVARRRRPTVVA